MKQDGRWTEVAEKDVGVVHDMCNLKPQAATSHSISPLFQFYLAWLFFFPPHVFWWAIPQKLLHVATNSFYKHDEEKE